MKEISLKKLFAEKNVQQIVIDFLGNNGSEVGVYDEKGTLVFGADVKRPGKKGFEIIFGDSTLGWVYGDGKEAGIARFLDLLVDKENEKRSLARDALEKYKEINLLYNLAENLNSLLDLERTAQFIINEAVNVVRATHAFLFYSDTVSGALSCLSSSGEPFKNKPAKKKIEEIAREVIREGCERVFPHVALAPSQKNHGDDSYSLISAPLKAHDKTNGCIIICHEDQIPYTARDLKVFMALASQAALVLENVRLYDQMKKIFLATANLLAETLEKRDYYTGNHTKRVMTYAVSIGREMGLNEDALTRLQLASILHDIGKIALRDNILLKDTNLDTDEITKIEKHTIIGEEIIKRIGQLDIVLPGIRQHHERFDGKGYPDGLRGEDIDLSARIISVADAFDAMTSDRPYRKRKTKAEAIAEIKNCANKQFDPSVVASFLKIFGNHRKRRS
jgi:putative nucleotidyltransferase with HDIG domain